MGVCGGRACVPDSIAPVRQSLVVVAAAAAALPRKTQTPCLRRIQVTTKCVRSCTRLSMASLARTQPFGPEK